MKKILIIGTTDIYGGVGHIMFELCQNMDLSNVHFDFMYYKDITSKERQLISDLGGEFFLVPRYSKNPKHFVNYMKSFFSKHSYDIVHCHASTSSIILYTFPLWKSNTTKIVYQSHTDNVSGIFNKALHRLFKPLVEKHSQIKIAISAEAAAHMYNKKTVSNNDYILLHNGINLQKFSYSKTKRDEIRTKLNINDDDFVLGNVGRFCQVKNHFFTLKVFKLLVSQNPHSKLILVGDGELLDDIRKYVSVNNLENNVVMYGTTDHVGDVLQAMDCFIFPSLFEGLGIVAIEAQASDLPVIASTNVPTEAKLTDKFIYKNLTTDTPESWVNTILSFKNNSKERSNIYDILKSSGYDILTTADKLEDLYMNI